jgi:hypothetical protein
VTALQIGERGCAGEVRSTSAAMAGRSASGMPVFRVAASCVGNAYATKPAC